MTSQVDDNSAYTHQFKLVLLGESGVGKTSLKDSFVKEKFFQPVPTIGVEMCNHNMDLEGKKVVVSIFDTAGQERYKAITRSFYRGSHGIILVYDVCCRSSFVRLVEHLNESKIYVTPTSYIIVGNKSDKEGREVSTEEGKQLASNYGFYFFETSAFTRFNVQESFRCIVRDILLKVISTGNCTSTASSSCICGPTIKISTESHSHFEEKVKTDKEGRSKCCN